MHLKHTAQVKGGTKSSCNRDELRLCPDEFEAVYALIREFGDVAGSLFYRHRHVGAVRVELVAREKEEQRREARAMVREDRHPLKQPEGRGGYAKVAA